MYQVERIPLPAQARSELEGHVAAGRPPEGLRGLVRRVLGGGLQDALQERAKHAATALAAGQCEAVSIVHDTPPALCEHEHGILAFVPISDRQTLMLDVSSVSDDPRWDLHSAGGLLRRRWRWLRVPGFDGAFGFTAEGAPCEARYLPELHGTGLETWLTEETSWPGDDAILDRPLAEIERLASRQSGSPA